LQVFLTPPYLRCQYNRTHRWVSYSGHSLELVCRNDDSSSEAFDIGDSVTVGNYTGTVKAINVLTTTIETLERLEITMPNKMLVDGAIVNNTKSPTRMWNFSFT